MDKKAAKVKAKAKTAESPNGTIPAGAVPQLVNQRVYDFLPVFLQALKEMNDNLTAIRKALED